MNYFFISVAIASAAILSCAYAASEPEKECGTITPAGEPLRRRRSTSTRGELPWHVTVYSKKTTPYRRQCGATLVSSKAVLSVAHCFWDHSNNKPLPAQDFAVAVGKLHQHWDAVQDQSAQTSDVSDIKIPPRFRGIASNLQDDISVVILASKITFTPFLRPVCLDFNEDSERRQLQANNLGKIASWAPTGTNKDPSKVLRVLELPYIPIEECLSTLPSGFREFVTSDKICAGSTNGTGLCKGNSGSGISFPDQNGGVSRYYLRGIASSSPTSGDGDECSQSLILFTQVAKHEAFIKQFI
ncbi:hypothetical protein ABMA28_012895 [Loxostege sticticalis]|uniref:Peptidase S1 domain-containing protein n=1 Tax=Loxostege sticticalis TaxID=481309 RepID=A0ABD0S339_LOXSC